MQVPEAPWEHVELALSREEDTRKDKGQKNTEEASTMLVAFWFEIYVCANRLRYTHDGKNIPKHI